MSRYKAGNFVAVINRFDRCGYIVGIDEKGKGYRINTGQDVIYRYEKELVLISSDAPINFGLVTKKLDAASTSEIQSSGVNNNILNFLKTNTHQAKAFGDWIVKMPKETLRVFLEVVKESGISLPDTVNINLGIVSIPITNK
ncbi:hypothetical protein NG799_25830 [Laspinema sp. D1]|uniref:Uncharacterized protein n=1 Tax=Laspinema palackyanum D2a TaxID=2953684 RepID=A0ABT2MYX9_9CYAN|nr:hypothetical protein [Laspinema sp. D2a]